jgi:hypothetical protein
MCSATRRGRRMTLRMMLRKGDPMLKAVDALENRPWAERNAREGWGWREFDFGSLAYINRSNPITSFCLCAI